VRADRQAPLHPTVISHGYGAGFHAEFDWVGTGDPTPWLCIPHAIAFLGGLLPGGWPELMQRNHVLALEARDLMLAAVQAPPPCPDSMIGSMASIALPQPAAGSIAAGLGREDLVAWFRAHGVQTWLHHDPLPVLRVSAQAYNRIEQFERLAGLLRLALYGDGRG
jgi:isopenicillin-N epimerase